MSDAAEQTLLEAGIASREQHGSILSDASEKAVAAFQTIDVSPALQLLIQVGDLFGDICGDFHCSVRFQAGKTGIALSDICNVFPGLQFTNPRQLRNNADI